MTCEELRDDYGPWALGIAEEPVRSEIAAHLARECPVCVAGVRSALATGAVMSGAVTEADPPNRLRQRVIGMVAPQPKRAFGILPWAVSAVLAIALVLTVGIRHPEPPPALPPDLTKLAQTLEILNDPLAKDVTFGDPAARGRVFVSPKGIVLIAAHLPKLDANHTFELWILPAVGKPLPAGTFNAETASNAGSTIYVSPNPIANPAAVAVTVEPVGGSPQPTTTPFIVSRL